MKNDTVVKALTPEEITRVEARQNAERLAAEAVAEQAAKPAPKFVGGKIREKILPLAWPLEYDGVTYESLTVRRMKGKDFEIMATFRDAEDGYKMGALLTGAPEEVIQALDAEDFVELQEAIQSFLPPKMQAVAGQISGSGQNTQR